MPIGAILELLIDAGFMALKRADGTEVNLEELRVKTTAEKLAAMGVTEDDVEKALNDWGEHPK